MLGVIAIKLAGTKLEWDAEKVQFANNDQANAFLNPPPALAGRSDGSSPADEMFQRMQKKSNRSVGAFHPLASSANQLWTLSAPQVSHGSFGKPTAWAITIFWSDLRFRIPPNWLRSSSCTTLANPAEAQKR